MTLLARIIITLIFGVVLGCSTYRTAEQIGNSPSKPEPTFSGLSHMKRRTVDTNPPCKAHAYDPEPHSCKSITPPD